MTRRFVGAVLGTVLLLTVASSGRGAAAGPQERSTLQPHATSDRYAPPGRDARGPGGGTAGSRGHMVTDREAYAAAKREAARRGGSAPSRAAGARAPALIREFEGIFDPASSPSDSTGAVGPTRYVELVNVRYGIYDRSTFAPLSEGFLGDLTGNPNDAGDPQIIWDPDTNRFYYTTFEATCLDVPGAVCGLNIGWSTSDSPSTAADWCKYFFPTGGELTDYPKLGDSADFILIGANTFQGNNFVGADVIWVAKPAAGASCPPGSAVLSGARRDLRNADGTQAFTPVPANQTDSDPTGWVVATPDLLTTPTVSFLSLFRVTRNADGTANVTPTGISMPVDPFGVPPQAPQPGTDVATDTLEGRLTQAVAAIDPRYGGQAVWTQHTVGGGAGAMIRWYEIDPVSGAITQAGSVSHPTLFAFNGAVSPDRRRGGGTVAFGDSMVLGFSTSSTSSFFAIQMVSKVGAEPQSGFTLVRQSQGPNIDPSCFEAPIFCRWGDYSAATPDPAADPAGAHGVVWLTNAYNTPSVSDGDVDWRTLNWVASPMGVGALCPGLEDVPGNHVVGTPANDRLGGTPGADVICGLGGNDVIFGLDGDDIILAGDGNDVASGGNGDDRIQGDAGADKLYGAAGSDRIWGLGDGDTLYGNADDDTLRGGVGDDALVGGAGDDLLAGEAGFDRHYGQGDNDRLLARDGLADVRVDGGPGFNSCAIDPGLDVPINC